MRLSALLGKTLRHPPSEAHLTSHQLLVRGGYVRAVAPGVFAYLPLGWRVLDGVREVLARALAPLAAQGMRLPPPGSEETEQEAAAALVHLIDREVDSYRQLPLFVWHGSAVGEAEPRVRDGLFGADGRPSATVHAFVGEEEGAEEARSGIEEALCQLFETCELPVVWADAGAKGRRAYLLHKAGDEKVARCPACGYAAPRPWAATRWPAPPDEEAQAPEEIETPGCDTIAALAEFLDIPAARTLKMVFYSVEGDVTCVVIRGDRQVDESKLARALGTAWYYTSMEHELEAIGAVGGYASPIGLDSSRVRVIADPSVRSGKNFVSGANRPDYHIRNVNVPRDFEPGEWVDLARIESGDACPECGGDLAVEAAFALISGSVPVPCEPAAEYLDQEGRARPLWHAIWHVDLARLVAGVVESHNDDYGIVWPVACAPFDVHIVALDLNRQDVADEAEALYMRLTSRGLSVLYDDRDASAGVKFNDADLIGVPLRLTIGKRSLKEGVVEARWRAVGERLKLDADGLDAELERLHGG
jgi:prolyl-tRNA synthetase